MAEDSGAFKTNPAHSGRFTAFVIARDRRCRQASLFRNHFPPSRRPGASPIFNNRRGSHAVFFKSA
jgi:hypothetical protein